MSNTQARPALVDYNRHCLYQALHTESTTSQLNLNLMYLSQLTIES